MDGNRQNPYNAESHSNGEYDPVEILSVEQLQRLVHLLDHSDVSEIELKRPEVGTRLVLRKAGAAAMSGPQTYQTPPILEENAETTLPIETKQHVKAPLVGIFHSGAKPKGLALVSVGDQVKVGQLVGTIQSLNVMNDVESPVAGRVTEILVQEGHAVEYGQHLMTIDSAEGA